LRAGSGDCGPGPDYPQRPEFDCFRARTERPDRLVAPSGLPEATLDLVAVEHLGRAIAVQASTVACQDRFLLVTFVFVVALLPTWSIGWMDRRRRMV